MLILFCRLALLKLQAKGKRETVEEAEKRKENDAKERARMLKVKYCKQILLSMLYV